MDMSKLTIDKHILYFEPSSFVICKVKISSFMMIGDRQRFMCHTVPDSAKTGSFLLRSKSSQGLISVTVVSGNIEIFF